MRPASYSTRRDPSSIRRWRHSSREPRRRKRRRRWPRQRRRRIRWRVSLLHQRAEAQAVGGPSGAPSNSHSRARGSTTSTRSREAKSTLWSRARQSQLVMPLRGDRALAFTLRSLPPPPAPSLKCIYPVGYSDHVLHGYSRRSPWVSTSTSRESALLYAIWLHAKAGPAPRAPPHVHAKLSQVCCRWFGSGWGGRLRILPPRASQERARRLEAARAPANMWEAQLSEYIIEIDRDELPEGSVVSLETTRDRAAAKVRDWKAARRSQALCEVLINCHVTVSSVRAAYIASTSSPRMARAWRASRRITLRWCLQRTSGCPRGTRCVPACSASLRLRGHAGLDGGEVELPDVVWREFADTAASGLGRHY